MSILFIAIRFFLILNWESNTRLRIYILSQKLKLVNIAVSNLVERVQNNISKLPNTLFSTYALICNFTFIVSFKSPPVKNIEFFNPVLVLPKLLVSDKNISRLMRKKDFCNHWVEFSAAADCPWPKLVTNWLGSDCFIQLSEKSLIKREAGNYQELLLDV